MDYSPQPPYLPHLLQLPSIPLKRQGVLYLYMSLVSCMLHRMPHGEIVDV